MGKQIMLVNVHEDETRIALVENNILFGLHVQQTDRERKVGNIYRGRIVKINPAFQAGFVDYGESRNGFLSISDVNFQLHKPKDAEKGRPKIQNVLHEGQSVMVQIIKEGMSNKGSALTTFISLAGRYMVMSPNSDRSGVSRKIEDPDTRRRLKDTMEALAGGEDLGVIIRTAGIDQPVSELKKDLEALRKEWKAIQGRYDKQRKPGLLHQEASPIVRVLRDYFTDSVQEVWVDDAEGFQEALRYFKSTLPKFQKRLKLYVGDKSLFSAYRVEEQIESLDSAKVSLKSGGSIVIASTEALVSIDVNSGRSNQAQDIEDTALRTNMEAAEEIARQLRLRNLGGLIVIDFIDMMQAKNRKQVEKCLSDALKDDKARTTIGSISQFGLLELSRQRIDMELSRGLRVQCPSCGGSGYIPTVNSSSNNVLRKLREVAATGQYTEIHGELPMDAANYLLNEKREALRDLELEFEIAVKLEADPDLPPGHPIALHGIKAGQGEAEPGREVESAGRAEPRAARSEDRGEDRSEERPAAAGENGGEDGGRRRRRRRRRRGGAERGYREPSRFTEEPLGAPTSEWEQPGMAAANALDEELEVESMEVEQEGEEAMAELVEGGHAFETPHAELHVEPGVVQQRPQHEPAIPLAPSGNGQSMGLMFKSEHIVTDPEALEKLPPRMVRSNPFRGISEHVPPNTVVFDSAGVLTSPAAEDFEAFKAVEPVAAVEAAVEREVDYAAEDGGAADGGAEDGGSPDNGAAPGAAGGKRRRRRGRRGGGASAPGGTPHEAAAPKEPAAHKEAASAAAAAPAHKRPRRARGRPAGSRPEAQPLPTSGPTLPRARAEAPDPEHEPGDVNGNVVTPQKPGAPHRPRPGRGRGRGSRPPGQKRAATLG